ncbi:MAG: hypothetical protein ACM33T_06165 [Solirubrobacterales bacterium]
MNLLDLMTQGADPEDLVLERLETVVALYDSDDDSVQDEALARAIGICGKQWGGYKAGMEALAKRVEARSDDPISASLDGLRLREEAEDPGALIRAARSRRLEANREDRERAAVIARYGSLEQALAPTALERMFIDAAIHLVDGEDGEVDAWSSLAGWSLPWHPVPAPLRAAVAAACPLPATVTDARDEVLSWEARRRELDLLSGGPGAAALPTACAARWRVVEEMWRRDLPVRGAAELEARLEYWSSRGGDDGAGYAVVLGDLRAVMAAGGLQRPSEGTKERARRLKAENPDWSLARIGKVLGISRQAVHKHLKG